MRYALEVEVDGVKDLRMLAVEPESVVLRLYSYTEEVKSLVAEKVVL